VLSEARTFDNRVIFSTFTPPTPHTNCAPQPGTNRTYAMSVYEGHPVLNLDSSVDSTTLTMDDLFVEADGGILPAPQALFLERDTDGDGIDDAADGATALVCVGLRCLSGVMRDEPIRTFWSQESVD
jgi:type IV pilus assembly protein PilY1